METVEQVKMRMERMLKPDRLAHSYGVAEEARRLAGRYGADPQQAYYAGLCHDMQKYAVGRTVAMDKKVCYNSG